MPARNLCPNPAAANSISGWSAAVAAGGTVTPTRVTSGLSGWDRPTAARVTTPANPGAWTQLISAAHDPGVDLSGKTFTATGEWMASAAPGGELWVFASFKNASGADVGYSPVTVAPVTANNRTRTTVIGTAPANTRRVVLVVFGNNAAAGWQATLGGVRIDEVNDPSMVFADGATSGWSWDGAAGNSTSTGPEPAAGSQWPWIVELLNEPPAPAEAVDDFTDQPDGPLVAADTGQPWTVTTAGTRPIASEVRGGAIRPPAGWTVPSTDTAGVSAGYAYLPFPAPVTWVGAHVAWDPTATSSNQGGGCLASCNELGYQGTTTTCPVHLSFGWNFVEMAVFQNGIANFTTLIPAGGSTSMVTLANPMPRDGATTTRLDVVVDRTVGKAWVTVGTNPLLVYTDPRISLASSWAFFQHYLPAGSINVPRYVKVWASSKH